MSSVIPLPDRRQNSFHFAVPDLRQCIGKGEFRRLLLSADMAALMPRHLVWKLANLELGQRNVRFFALSTYVEIVSAAGTTLGAQNMLGHRVMLKIMDELLRFGLSINMSLPDLLAWQDEGGAANDTTEHVI